ncbi:MAG: hypothetical protein ACPHAS_02705 [Synechococcus sp.]
MAHSNDLPLITALPRAWLAFSKAPWTHVGLSCLVLISGIGLALIGQDLRALHPSWLNHLGDLSVLGSVVVPIVPGIALLELADRDLPGHQRNGKQARRRSSWVLQQSFILLVLEGLCLAGGLLVVQSLSWMLGHISPTLAGLSVIAGSLLLLHWLFTQVMALPLLVHHHHHALQAMAHSRHLVNSNGLKVLAMLGLITGLNLLGLLAASLGLLLSLPFSALVLMACCRSQTPWRSDSRRNILPT